MILHRQKEGAPLLAGEEVAEYARLLPRRDDVGDAEGRDLLGGHDLAAHAAGAHIGGLVRGRLFDHLGDLPDQGYHLGLLRPVGIVVVETLRIGEVDEEVGFGDVGHHGRQMVIVAEFDFIDGDSIVFVDYGDNSPVHKGGERIADVEEALPIREVAHGQEDLGHVDAILSEGVGIDPHQASLADGGGCLFLGHALQGARKAHAVLARGYGPGGYDDDVVAPLLQFDHLLNKLLDDVEVQTVVSRKDGAADLDEHLFDVLENLFARHDVTNP